MNPRNPRLDQLLVSRGFVSSRELAQSLILRGDVLIADVPFDKPGTRVPPDADIRIRGELSRYVSRGGDKLEGALKAHGIDPQGKVALDIGSSTGGFTDCLLQCGARVVYAVDVGTNQLAEKLRHDPRVKLFEQFHVKDLTREMFEEPPVLATVDVSFIGLRKIIPFIADVMGASWEMLLLVKPQFELEREQIGKGGVVRSSELQLEAVTLVADYVRHLGFHVNGHSASVLKGGKKGNQEYFLYVSTSAASSEAE